MERAPGTLKHESREMRFKTEILNVLDDHRYDNKNEMLVWYGGAAAIRGGQAGGGSHSAGDAQRARNDPGVKQEADCPPANFWKY